MPATMEKKDVLYRVAYKTRDSIKWGIITKLNNSKAVAQPTIEEVNKLLTEPKNKKMELKVGMVHKDGKTSLVLRVKNGGDHLYDAVINKNYTQPTESEKGEYENKQIEGLKAANKELDEYIDMTKVAVNEYGKFNLELGMIDKQFEDLSSRMRESALEKTVQQRIFEQYKKWLKRIDELPSSVKTLLERHGKEVDPLRLGGAGKLASKNNVDDQHSQKLKARFMQHTKLYADFEHKCRGFPVKAHELANNITSDLDVGEGRVSVADATLTMVKKTAEQLATMAFNTERHLKFTEFEAALKATPKTSVLVNLEATIDRAQNNIEQADKAGKRLGKFYKARVAKVPKTEAEKGLVKTELEKMQSTMVKFLKTVNSYRSAGMKAIEHSKSVVEEINKLNSK